jgi:CRISPR-associated endonuclease Csn1
MQNELVYSFDLGSGSMGVCVRRGKDVLLLDSLLIDNEFGSVKETTLRRRQIRTRVAHKEREKWWDKQAKAAGIEVLSTAQPTKKNPDLKPDKRMLIEFLPENSTDNTIYSSHLLRIALLQDAKLEGWQVYKAIRSAMQRRGYDANFLKENSASGNENEKEISIDEKDNKEATSEYSNTLKQLFSNKDFHYPCYYEAYEQEIWDPNIPKDFRKRLSSNPNPSRNKENKQKKLFPSRELVAKELKALLVKASKFFPKLKGKEDFIIYGPAKKAYASFNDNKYAKYRGTAWDWQGLLGQKIPRFDNRIISKCRLIPRLNVCKANKPINKEVLFLLDLKNMRYSKKNITTMQLTPEQIKYIFKVYTEYSESEKAKVKINRNDNPLTKTFWKNYVKILGGVVNPGQQEIPKTKDVGRSNFCKPALNVLHSLILSGKNPHDYYKELVASNKNTDVNKGLIKEDYKFLLDMPNDWNSVSIPDTRENDKNLSHDKAEDKINKIISGISNRIVRHRLEMLLHLLEKLNNKYGVPDRIIFEIGREEFVGEAKKKEYTNNQKENKKKKDNVIIELKDAKIQTSAINILKARLFDDQKGYDIYDTSNNRNMSFLKLESYEIEHIIPQARGGSDAYVNFILTKPALNKDKGDLTPFEWFHKKRLDDWETYWKNVFNPDLQINDKKKELLTSDKADELEKRKSDLQATFYLEKLSQRIASLYFGFGINTKGDTRKIQFFTGGETANIRSKLDLNEVLYQTKEDFEEAKKNGLREKNRKNKKHHALDALVLSMLPEIKTNKREIEEKPKYFDKKYVQQKLKDVVPKSIKQDCPKLRETTYALRYRIDRIREKKEKRYYFVSRFDSSIDNFRLLDGKKKKDKCARKNVEKIFDLRIKADFEKKLEDENLPQGEWENFLKEYTADYKKIKKISMIDSQTDPNKAFKESDVFNPNGTIKEIIGEYGQKGAVKGQWIKGKESHNGQILYKDNEKWKVVPIYVFESVYKKRKEYENKYGDVKFFKSGDNVELKRDYENIKAGVYKLRTILTNGTCKIENINNPKDIKIKNINIFLEQCGMESYKQID